MSRVLTVACVNIRGYFALAEPQPPDRVARLLGIYDTAIATAFREHHGQIVKHMSDQILALWEDPDGPGHAVEGALAAVAAGPSINAALVGHGLPPIRYGIGINTGEVATVDLTGERSYDVLGDSVNVAVFLAGVAGGGEILAAASTRDAVGARLMAEETEPLRLRHRRSQTVVYRVVSLL